MRYVCREAFINTTDYGHYQDTKRHFVMYVAERIDTSTIAEMATRTREAI